MRNMTINEWLKTIIMAAAILLFLGNVYIFYKKAEDVIPRVEMLEKNCRVMKVEQYCSYRYMDALAKKILTKEEYEDLKTVVNIEKEDLKKLLNSTGNKK